MFQQNAIVGVVDPHAEAGQEFQKKNVPIVTPVDFSEFLYGFAPTIFDDFLVI
jgi:hypothetical protein